MAKTKIEEFFKSLEEGSEELQEQQEQQGQPEQQSQQEAQQPVVSEQQEATSEPSTEQPLIAGKFKTVDDLLGSYQELERKFYEIQERLKRAEQGLEAFSKTTQPLPQQQEVDIDVDPLVDPKGFAKKISDKITQNVLSQISQQMTLQQQMAEVRRRFYELNPDLVGKERLVGLIAQDVSREMPNAPLDTVLEEIAKRTRQFLKSLTTTQQKVVQQPTNQIPTPQMSISREKITPPPEKELTPEEIANEYIKQRKEFLSKKKF